MEISELTQRQLSERIALDKRQKKEAEQMDAGHKIGRSANPNNNTLAIRQEKELKELKATQSADRQRLYEKHKKEYIELDQLKKIGRKVNSYEAERYTLAMTYARREEKENMRIAHEAEMKRRQSLIDKMKEHASQKLKKGRTL